MLLQLGFGLIVQCAFLINFMAVFALVFNWQKRKENKAEGFFVSKSI